MILKNKYSVKRLTTRLSWNLYNLSNIKKLNLKINLRGQSKPSIYSKRLKAKQQLKRYYGNIKEKQFSQLYEKANIYKGHPVDNLLNLLERRLDTVLFKIHFAPSIFAARQLISHGHVLVNNNKVSISSYLLTNHDYIQIKLKSFKFIKKLMLFDEIKRNIIKRSNFFHRLSNFKHIIVNYNTLSAIYLRHPHVHELHYPFSMIHKKIFIEKFYRKIK